MVGNSGLWSKASAFTHTVAASFTDPSGYSLSTKVLLASQYMMPLSGKMVWPLQGTRNFCPESKKEKHLVCSSTEESNETQMPLGLLPRPHQVDQEGASQPSRSRPATPQSPHPPKVERLSSHTKLLPVDLIVLWWKSTERGPRWGRLRFLNDPAPTCPKRGGVSL